MSDSGEQRWYFDFGDSSSESDDNSSDHFGRGIKVSTREDVAAGRSGTPFDLVIEDGSMASISGIDGFTQNMVVSFLEENDSFPPVQLDSSVAADYEQDFEQFAQRHDSVNRVVDVAVNSSSRQYDDEIEVTMTIDTGDDQYTTQFFIGPVSSL
jgi:hypothetical protein